MISRRARATLLTLAGALAPSVAHAQGRYRVVVGSAETMRGALVEFRPCVPAEGSDCGARVDRTLDFAQDSVLRAPPPTVSRAALWSGNDSLIVERGVVMQRGLGTKASTFRDPRGDAIAVALAIDPPYAFILLAGRGTNVDVLVMYDTDTRSVIANCPLRERARSVGLAPMR